MQRSSGARLLPIFITLVIVVALVVGVVALGRALFFNGGSSQTETPDKSVAALLNTSSAHSVRMTVRGPLVAQENYQSYAIEASSNSRSMTVYKGYLDTIENQKQLGNNQKAYEQFVYSLHKANMMQGTVPSDSAMNDLRGICATGYVYEYSVLTDDKPTKQLWTSTCSGSPGSLQASTNQLNSLFMNQMPGSAALNPFSDNLRTLAF